MVHVSWPIQHAHFAILLNSSEHDNHSRLVVPNHLPEVRDGGWSGSWRQSGVNKVYSQLIGDTNVRKVHETISLCVSCE